MTAAPLLHKITTLAMNGVLVILRFLFCLVGAAALLYSFSYPDNILPPNPGMEEAEGVHLYALKPFIWVIPVMFMEMVSLCGPRRNQIWFGALFTVLGAALVAYPVMAANWPEYVRPTFSYQGGMLTEGLVSFLAFTGISLAFRLVLLHYMFPPDELLEQPETGYVSASVLNPETARTVKEIAAENNTVKHRFHFKKADERLSLRWRLIMKKLLFRSRLMNYSMISGVLILILWFTIYPQPTEEEALQRDLGRMFEHRQTAQGIPLATTAAVHAAARVMKYISDTEILAGMTREQAEQWLKMQSVPTAYKMWLRDERDIELPSTNSTYENRTRFLTVTNGRCICVLYIRTSKADDSIVVAELQDAGWDARADEQRRRIGTDWGAFYN